MTDSPAADQGEEAEGWRGWFASVMALETEAAPAVPAWTATEREAWQGWLAAMLPYKAWHLATAKVR
jgi:hypothetical protein